MACLRKKSMPNQAWRILSAPPIALLMLAGCAKTDAPPVLTAAEAGATLKEHITRTLDGAQGEDIEVTDPGGKDISCSDGKVKRTYTAKARDSFYSGDRNLTLLAMIGSLSKVADYELDNSNANDTYQEAAIKDLYLRIIMSAPAEGSMMARGETERLPPK